MDEFIAGIMSNRAASGAEVAERAEPAACTDTSLTSSAAYGSGGHAAATANALARPMPVLSAAVIAIAPSRVLDEPRPAAVATSVENPPEYGSSRRRAEAWERERERCSSMTGHRKTS